MRDREYLEDQLTELRFRYDSLLNQKSIYLAEHNVYMEEIVRQVKSIEKHFRSFVQEVENGNNR